MIQEDNKSTTFFRFEDLRVYSKALGLVNIITQASCMVTNEIGNHFYNNFLDEATMIAINIAEGSTKNKSTFVSFLKVAKTNIRKCVVFCTIGRQNGFMTEENEEAIRMQLMELTKMVGALIISLQKNTNSSNYQNDSKEEFESEDFTW